MKVLLLHPEDEFFAERAGKRWDWIVDLGRAPLATYARWRGQTGGRVISLYDLSKDFADQRRVRNLLQLGMGQWVDGSGIDWWDVLSLMIEPDLRQLMLIGRLAGELPTGCEIYASRSQSPGGSFAEPYRSETSHGENGISTWPAMGEALSRCLHAP